MKNKKPQFSDVIKLRGCIELELLDARKDSPTFGQRVPGSYRKIDNTVVTSGRRWVLSRIKSDSPATETISYIGVGTGTVAPSTANTGLGSETVRKAIGTFTTTGLDANPPSWRAEVQFATNEANTTLGEAALFNSSAAGTMLSRVTFSATLDKTTSNTLSISYTVSN